MSQSNQLTTDEDDPYRRICREMQPGLLITVNVSDPTAAGTDEMKVLRVDEDDDVHLRGPGDEHFVLTFNGDHYQEPAIKRVGETEFSPRHDPVTTIEVIGIDG